MRFEDKVARLCEKRGWNQSDLARAVGVVSKNTVSRWWNGAVKPFDDSALILARVLGVSLDYLADDEQDEPPAASELSIDELTALNFYRRLRGGMGEVDALSELAALAAPFRTARPPVEFSGGRVVDEAPPGSKRKGAG